MNFGIKDILNNKALKWLTLIILFTVFSGAIRRWVIQSGAVGNVILAFQLAIPILFYLKLKNTAVINFYYSSLKSIFSAYIVILIITALNPLNYTIYHGLLGIIIYMALWLPIYTYLGNRENFQIEKLDIIILLTLSTQVIISGLQYTLPGDHALNVFASGKVNEAAVGDGTRASGTFSYLGGLQGFMVFWGFFAWYHLIVGQKKIITIIIIMSGFICALFTGSRGVMINYLVLCTMGIITSGNMKLYLNKFIPVAMLFLVVMFVSPNNSLLQIVNRSTENFQKRVESGNKSGETSKRISGSMFSAFNYHGDSPIIGYGLGSTYQGATIVFGISPHIATYGYLEDEPERIVLEGGYLLYLIRLFLFIAFLKVLNYPKWTKYIIFLLFSQALVVFNIYMSIFLALGLIWVDRAYYLKDNDYNNSIISNE